MTPKLLQGLQSTLGPSYGDTRHDSWTNAPTCTN